HFHPAETIRIGPDRIEDPREIHVDLAAALLQKMRQQEAHLVMPERVFRWEMEFVPHVLGRRLVEKLWAKLAPGVGAGAARAPHRTHQDTEKVQSARDLPAAQMPTGRSTPVVRGKTRSGAANLARHLHNHLGWHTALRLGELRRKAVVLALETSQKFLEGTRRGVGF